MGTQQKSVRITSGGSCKRLSTRAKAGFGVVIKRPVVRIAWAQAARRLP
jgi:hypothetical protein